MNVRSRVDSTEAVRTARMLSRLSLTGIASIPLTAEALAGLALLAALPRVSAQPGTAVVGPGSTFYGWVVAVCFGLLLFWGLRLFWSAEPGEMEASPGTTSELTGVDQQDSTAPQPGEVDGVLGGDANDSSSSEDFHTEEWAKAEEKLVAAERRTGLTFIQRARLRRQLLAGGVVDVPVFQQRYGGLPSWLTGGEPEEVLSLPWGRPSPQVVSMVSLFTSCGSSLLALIGSPAVEWSRLRACCRQLHRNAVLTLVGRVRDAGAVGGMPQDANFRAEFRAGQVGDRIQWHPIVFQNSQAGSVGFCVGLREVQALQFTWILSARPGWIQFLDTLVFGGRGPFQ